MKTIPTLFTGFLLLATVAQADVFKCPNGRGGQALQDAPCSVAAPQRPLPTAGQPAAAPLPRLSRQAQIDDVCQKVGGMALAFAEGRDRGVPLSQGLQMLTDMQARDASRAPYTPFFRKVLLEIYTKIWWTPAVARQRAEVACIQGFEQS